MEIPKIANLQIGASVKSTYLAMDLKKPEMKPEVYSHYGLKWEIGGLTVVLDRSYLTITEAPESKSGRVLEVAGIFPFPQSFSTPFSISSPFASPAS